GQAEPGVRAGAEEVAAGVLERGRRLLLGVEEHDLEARADFPVQDRIPSQGTVVPEVIEAEGLEVQVAAAHGRARLVGCGAKVVPFGRQEAVAESQFAVTGAVPEGADLDQRRDGGVKAGVPKGDRPGRAVRPQTDWRREHAAEVGEDNSNLAPGETIR